MYYKARSSIAAVLCPTAGVFILATLGGCSSAPGGSDPGGSPAGGQAGQAEGLPRPQALSRVKVPKARPAGVPDDFVHTPSGYFHPSCIREVGPDETILHAERRIARADGSTRDVEPCGYPHYDKRGKAVRDDEGEHAPDVNTWVESASDSSHGPYEYMFGRWQVPSTPPDPTSVVYLFNGFENLARRDRIIQPVLGLNMQDGPDEVFSIASWNCCVSGTVFHSSIAQVNQGDEIRGTMAASNCNKSTGVCASWTVTTLDETTGVGSYLSTTTGEAMDWAFGGVLEAYDIDDCDQYPAQFGIYFGDIWVESVSGTWPSLTFGTGVDTTDTPQCGYSVSQAGGNKGAPWVWLTY
jgi:hypothetical protein